MYYCIICKINHQSNIDGVIGRTSKTYIKHINILNNLITTNYCLNCFKGNNGICKDFNLLQEYLFNNKFSLNKRIDVYKYLSLLNKCYKNNDIHNVVDKDLFYLI